jgi:hypothetical protein
MYYPAEIFYNTKRCFFDLLKKKVYTFVFALHISKGTHKNIQCHQHMYTQNTRGRPVNALVWFGKGDHGTTNLAKVCSASQYVNTAMNGQFEPRLLNLRIWFGKSELINLTNWDKFVELNNYYNSA